MPRVPIVLEADAPENIAQIYGRIREMLGTEDIPVPFLAMGSVEPFLKDFYMNFKKFVYSEGKLDQRTRAIIALAVSATSGCDPWTQYHQDRARELEITPQQIAEILAVAATNAMYNVFFKFRSLSGSDLFEGMPVGLRAHTFSNTSLDDKTIELMDIALSDINGCKPCVTGHLAKARQLGVSDEAIQEAIQCAATTVAGCQFLNAAGH